MGVDGEDEVWGKGWLTHSILLFYRLLILAQVNTICRDPTTHEWILDINHNLLPEPPSDRSGRQFKLYCDKLVLAFGTSSEPNRPYIPGQEFVDEQNMVHSVELGDWCRWNLGIDVSYHHEPLANTRAKAGFGSGDKRWGFLAGKPSLEEYHPLVRECPPSPSPVTSSTPATPPLLPPPKTVAIYGGRKSAFDIVYFFATLPEHLRPVEIHWIFRPSASTPSRFAAPLADDSFLLNLFKVPDWLRKILPMPSIPIRMDELMAVRLVGLFERCGFESSVAGGGVMGIIPGIGRVFKKRLRNSSDALGLRGRGWVGRLLQETEFGQGVVDGLWATVDKTWETAEGIGEVEDGNAYKLKPETR